MAPESGYLAEATMSQVSLLVGWFQSLSGAPGASLLGCIFLIGISAALVGNQQVLHPSLARCPGYHGHNGWDPPIDGIYISKPGGKELETLGRKLRHRRMGDDAPWCSSTAQN